MSKRKTERLDLRLTPQSKQLLQDAAATLGVALSEFIVDAALDASRRVRNENELRVLSARDRSIFLKMLDDDADPNDELSAARREVVRLRGQ